MHFSLNQNNIHVVSSSIDSGKQSEIFSPRSYFLKKCYNYLSFIEILCMISRHIQELDSGDEDDRNLIQNMDECRPGLKQSW